MPDMVCVKTFVHRHEADLAKGYLESEGIPAFVSSDDLGGMRPNLGFATGARLLVSDEALEEATRLLAELENAGSD